MKKILIVDDHENNRIILKLLLNEFKNDNSGINFEIDEAEDGLIALEMATKKKYDLIFMDIMMPNLDGIEATAKIRNLDKSVMIIAVSAVDDANRQKQILSNGAEDYISKPINSDIFYSRVSNYFKLLNSRDKRFPTSDSYNHLFDDKVYSHNLTFFINDDDSLSEFWGYYLLFGSAKSELLSDVVRINFSLCELILKMDTKTTIVIEESETSKYFTLYNIDVLGKKIIDLVIYKNEIKLEYKLDEIKISFKIPQEPISSDIQTTSKIEEALHVEPKQDVDFSKSTTNLQIFSYMDLEDLEDIEIYIQKLNSLMLLVGNGSIEEDEVVEIAELLDSIARVMNIYSETYSLGQAIQHLSDTIHSNINIFIENATALGTMAVAFAKDLSTWERSVFHNGAPSVDYLDATIIANAQTISSMLNPNETVNTVEDVDDIFDF